jgi:hypothetical protein
MNEENDNLIELAEAEISALGIKRFDAHEMAVCPGCGRSNPPNRLKCLYCGGELPVNEIKPELLRTKFRRLETWEHGRNVVLLAADGSENEIAGVLIRELEFTSDDAQRLASAASPVPVARVESVAEAELVAAKITAAGGKCAVVEDRKLNAEHAPRRLRALELLADSLVAIDFNTYDEYQIAASDVVLIVSGPIFRSKVESAAKRVKGTSKVIDSMESSSDEMIIDIYDRSDAIGYRVSTSGFDFSCLAEEKDLLSAENIIKLTSRLREFAPAAAYVDSYSSIRSSLSVVWANEQRTDSKGMRQRGVGKKVIDKVATSDNLMQFTKFSRLQRVLS